MFEDIGMLAVSKRETTLNRIISLDFKTFN